jgi:hypothetical protein
VSVVVGAAASRRLVIYWLAIWLAAMLTYDYYSRVEDPFMGARMSLHHEIVSGTAPYQYRYRVLIPAVAEGLARVFQHAPTVKSRPIAPPLAYSKRAFVLAYASLNFAALAILFWSVGELVAELMGTELSWVAVTLSAILVTFTFRNHYYHPWSFWEGAMFGTGLLLIHQRRLWLFAILSLIGLLNRETSIFLVLILAATAFPDVRSREMRFAIGTMTAWVAGFFLLHYFVGYRPSTFFLETALTGNRENAWFALLLNGLLIGIVSPLILRGMFTGPRLIRRAALVLPLYLALLLVIGYWWEIRYWITAIPIIVPALIAAVVPTPHLASDVSEAAARARSSAVRHDSANR